MFPHFKRKGKSHDSLICFLRLSLNALSDSHKSLIIFSAIFRTEKEKKKSVDKLHFLNSTLNLQRHKALTDCKFKAGYLLAVRP